MLMTTPGEHEGEQVRRDLREQLKDLEAVQSQGTLAELAYRRSRDALERALEEAGKIRLHALEDARGTREREIASLMESLKALRESAEAQAQSVLAQAEIEATQMRDRARIDGDAYLDNARREAQEIAAEAGAMRHAAEDRVREVEKLEADFNEQVSRMTERLGIVEKPPQGWFGKLFKRP
jgi:chromosome segregation ATPase